MNGACLLMTGLQENRWKKIPASVDHCILTTDELILYGIGHKESDTTSGRPTSEQTARGAYRVVGVSRGHIKPE